MNVRSLRASDLEHAGAVLFTAFARSAEVHGYQPPWTDEHGAAQLLASYLAAGPEDVLVVEEGGVVIGVGAVRVRGEVATIGPIAAFVHGRGVGGTLLDGLLARADQSGASATRLYVDAWNPSAYALYVGRGFGVVDMVAHVERAPDKAPTLGSSRGLEVRPFEPRDLDELTRFDSKLTGHERERDLQSSVRLVARRRGSLVGYLATGKAAGRTWLGPGVAVDVSDLFTLTTNALRAADDESWFVPGAPVHARLSTSAPVAAMAALGLEFKVRELGVVMSRGAPPPTRPPQMYSVLPEVL